MLYGALAQCLPQERKDGSPLPGMFPGEMILPGVDEKHADLHRITLHVL